MLRIPSSAIAYLVSYYLRDKLRQATFMYKPIKRIVFIYLFCVLSLTAMVARQASRYFFLFSALQHPINIC